MSKRFIVWGFQSNGNLDEMQFMWAGNENDEVDIGKRASLPLDYELYDSNIMKSVSCDLNEFNKFGRGEDVGEYIKKYGSAPSTKIKKALDSIDSLHILAKNLSENMKAGFMKTEPQLSKAKDIAVKEFSTLGIPVDEIKQADDFKWLRQIINEKLAKYI